MKETQKHTPGPWIFDDDCAITTDPWGLYIYKQSDENEYTQIAEVGDGIQIGNGNESEPYAVEAIANARLIAAAPEMKRCLEDMLNCDGDLDSMDFGAYRDVLNTITR